MPFEVKHSVTETAVTWSVVMMEHPFVCNVWSHTNYSFSEPFKEVFIKTLLTVCPRGTNSVWTIACSVASLITFLSHLLHIVSNFHVLLEEHSASI